MLVLIFILLSLHQHHAQRYIALPFTRQHNQQAHKTAYFITTTLHHQYLNMQITLQSRQQPISIMQGRTNTNNSSHLDKLALIQYRACQLVDERIPLRWRIIYHHYYSIRNALAKHASINLRNDPRPFHFTPNNIKPTALTHLRHYNPYVNNNIVAFFLRDQDQGELIFGGFPFDKLEKKGQIYTTKLQGSDKWSVKVSSLAFASEKEALFIQNYDLPQPFNINFNSKTIISQKMAAFITSQFKGCEFEELSEITRQKINKNQLTYFQTETRRYLICSTQQQYLSLTKSMALVFKFADSQAPITITFQDLGHRLNGNKYLLDLDFAETNDFQLGENVLKSYILAIDYNEMKLIYGTKATFLWPTINSVIAFLWWSNGLILGVSVGVIWLLQKRYGRVVLSQRGEGGLAKCNEYELADMQESVEERE